MTLAEIFNLYWPAYAAKFGRIIPPEQYAAVRAIRRCRTPALGGQAYRCDCGKAHFTYRSCNHRACPRCGREDAELWLARQRTRLLPVPYFLVTFTVPEQLREPIRAAQRIWYAALLRESAGALQDLAAQPKHLGAELGLTAMLQTWTRDLRYHPHVHYLVPAGGLTPNRLRWVHVKDFQYFLPPAKLAARFKGRLKSWFKQNEPELFKRVHAKVWWMKWNVDFKAVGSGDATLKYLASYLYRPPLHESQIECATPQGVTFRYRDNQGVQHRATLTGEEFLRRLLQHVLPKGFQRVRYYGWRSPAGKTRWNRILTLLDWISPVLIQPAPVAPPQCPCCHKPMFLIGTLPRAPT